MKTISDYKHLFNNFPEEREYQDREVDLYTRLESENLHFIILGSDKWENTLKADYGKPPTGKHYQAFTLHWNWREPKSINRKYIDQILPDENLLYVYQEYKDAQLIYHPLRDAWVRNSLAVNHREEGQLQLILDSMSYTAKKKYAKQGAGWSIWFQPPDGYTHEIQPSLHDMQKQESDVPGLFIKTPAVRLIDRVEERE